MPLINLLKTLNNLLTRLRAKVMLQLSGWVGLGIWGRRRQKEAKGGRKGEPETKNPSYTLVPGKSAEGVSPRVCRCDLRERARQTDRGTERDREREMNHG